MSDAGTIQSAYAAALGRLFSDYVSALADAAGDADAEAQALARFKAGVALARKARDRALAVVGQG